MGVESDSDVEEADDESSDTSSSPEKENISSVGNTKGTGRKPASIKKAEGELDAIPVPTGKSASPKQKVQSSVKPEAVQPRHDKPRKKSWVHKIGDFFES